MDPTSKYRPRREYHYWGWSSSRQLKSLDGIEHVRAVIALLDGKEHKLAQLRTNGCEIDVCCYWVSSGQGGPFLDNSALTHLSHFGLSIWWDVYFGEEDEYAEDASKGAAGVS
jgi:hypothetical protein